MRVDVVIGWQSTLGLSGRDDCAGLVREVIEREKVHEAACWYGCLQDLVQKSLDMLHFELPLVAPR